MIRIGLLLLLLWSSVLGAAQVEACLLEPDPGPCEAAIPAWHFHPLTQMCTEFTWGGQQSLDQRMMSPGSAPSSGVTNRNPPSSVEAIRTMP